MTIGGASERVTAGLRTIVCPADDREGVLVSYSSFTVTRPGHTAPLIRQLPLTLRSARKDSINHAPDTHTHTHTHTNTHV